MKTPLYDFIKNYAEKKSVRMHMPGHKGKGELNVEGFDITEIDGADSLYHSDGIIEQSRKNASLLFGCPTFYSTEGSSHCIRSMLYLSSQKARMEGKTPYVLAGRNVHKSFISGIAINGIDCDFIYPEKESNYISCPITAKDVERSITKSKKPVTAVYITTPDYLGNVLDVKSIAKVCIEQGVTLMVDNAHGAYLKFLTPSKHPIDLGADMCCDSAHKTLGGLTGSAYLHVKEGFGIDDKGIKNAMSLFGSSSPSYLTLASLDLINKELFEGYNKKLKTKIEEIELLKSALEKNGYSLYGNEEIKITLNAKEYGYYGQEIAKILLENNVYPEFYDKDFVVLMASVNTDGVEIEKLKEVLLSIKRLNRIEQTPPKLMVAKRVKDIKEAVFASQKRVNLQQAIGKTAGLVNAYCPPAIPIVVSGEQIDLHAIDCLKYYNIEEIEIID